MSLFIIVVLEIVMLGLLISMIYSLGQLSKEYHEKMSNLAMNLALLEHRLDKLTGIVNSMLPETDIEGKEDNALPSWMI